MAYLPVICDRCGTFFLMPNLIGGSGTVALEGNTVGPCPTCRNKKARILDGTYKLANDTVALLQGTKQTEDDLKRFADILLSILAGNTSVEQAQATASLEVPELTPLIEEIRKTRNAEWQRFWISVVLKIVLAFLVSQEVNIDIDAVINNTTQEYYEQQQNPNSDLTTNQAPEPMAAPRRVRKVGRNDPCPCDSGKKYKKCCGDPTK